jgi:hypothetical protein
MIRANAIAKRTITGQLLEIAMAQSFCAVMITDARLDGEGLSSSTAMRPCAR